MWPNPQKTENLVTFNEEFLNGKLHFLCSDTYVNSSKDINDKDPKFKIGDTVRISKYKNMFAKGYVLNWSEEVFLIKKIKTLFRGPMLFVILIAKKFLVRFTKKICKIQSKKNLELKK